MAWEGLILEVKEETEVENIAATLASFVQSHVLNQPSGKYNLLYKMGNQESVIQIDTQDHSSIKSFFVDKYHRPATAPIKAGLEKVFSEADISHQFTDISRVNQLERLHAEMARKSDESNPNYQNTKPSLEPSEALKEIDQYRDNIRPALLQDVKVAAQARFGFFGGKPVSNKPPVAAEKEIQQKPSFYKK